MQARGSMTHLSNKMHSSEFSTDVLFAKWRAQESMAQWEIKKKEGKAQNETIKRQTTCESKKEGWGGNDGARASHHLCGFPGPHRSTFPPTPPRESLASVRGFLNHRWRLQVLHLRLIHQVSHRKKSNKWRQQREFLTCASAERAGDNEAQEKVLNHRV